MKIKHIFFLTVCFTFSLFIFPSLSLADWSTMECYALKYNPDPPATRTVDYAFSGYTDLEIDEGTGVVSLVPGIIALGEPYLYFASNFEFYIYDETGWHKIQNVSTNYLSLAAYNEIITRLYAIDVVPTEPCDPCPTLESDAVAGCGGSADYVASIDYELCEYTCHGCDTVAQDCVSTCSPFSVDNFSCSESTDDEGNVVALNIAIPCQCMDSGCGEYEAACDQECSGYYDFSCETDADGFPITHDCTCNECDLETDQWATANCGGLQYLDWYDCPTGTGACLDRDCNDLLNDCIDQCEGSVLEFHCLNVDDEPVVTTPCTCDDEIAQNNNPDDDPLNNNDNEQLPEDGDTDNSLLQKIANNTAVTSDNVKAVNETLNRELNELNQSSVTTNNLLRQSNDTLKGIASDLSEGLSIQGSATYPDDNSYDTAFTQPEENSLIETIGTYINAGLPLQQFLSESGFTVSNIDPTLSCVVWDHEILFDASPMEGTLNWMGLVVFAVSTISAFMIVIKR